MFCVVALSLSIVAATIPTSQVLDASKSRYYWERDGSVHYSMVMKASSPEKLVCCWKAVMDGCHRDDPAASNRVPF